VKFATELGIVCAVDPLVQAPGDQADPLDDLDAASLYFRVENAGRAGTIRSERLEELAALLEGYDDRDLTVVFASAERWSDARNFKKLLTDG
jgi:hypothetical protein